MRGATQNSAQPAKHRHISTHTPLARRDNNYRVRGNPGMISTHTPLARRDLNLLFHDLINFLFLLTRLLRGATTTFHVKFSTTIQFLLTRLLRGATAAGSTTSFETLYFYSHASCEARLILIDVKRVTINFYSHASCEARPAARKA